MMPYLYPEGGVLLCSARNIGLLDIIRLCASRDHPASLLLIHQCFGALGAHINPQKQRSTGHAKTRIFR